jgi:hypothetical protein
MEARMVPAVDPEDFKKCWQLRRELDGSIDLECYRQLCKARDRRVRRCIQSLGSPRHAPDTGSRRISKR